jgi:signal transduction histidine kinase
MELLNKTLDWPLEDGTIVNWHEHKIRLSILAMPSANCVMLNDLNETGQSIQLVEPQGNIEQYRNQLRHGHELRTARENFTVMIAHEFGTPLSVIRAKSSLLSTHLDRLSKDQIAQHFFHIEAQVNHMVDLLDDLVFINRVGNAQEICQPEPLDLIPFCKSLLDQIAHRWEAHEVIFTASSRITTVALDRRVVHYMLSNLLSNAFKYSPARREIRLDIQDAGQSVIFSFTDQGIGIPSAEVDKIFTPLYRASNASEFNGMGLGLAVVKTSVEACGGSIKVESKLGEGTTFVVSLPRENRSAGSFQT